MTSFFMLSRADFAELSAPTQAELMARFLPPGAIPPGFVPAGATTPPSPPVTDGDDWLADLTPAQARRMIQEEMGGRPWAILEFFVRQNRAAIPYPEVIAAVGADYRGGIGTATAALTRRFRGIVPEAPANCHFYFGRRGVLSISPATLAALREVWPDPV